MKARDVMTEYVISVDSQMSVVDIAAILLAHRISAVPVVDGGSVVGMVSEGDLMRRREIGTDGRRRSWWLAILGDADAAKDYIKSHGLRARDVMTRNPITVAEDTPLEEIAEIFEAKHIKRVPVLRDGALSGIVSRANLIQALAATKLTMDRPAAADDASIRARLIAELEKQPWWRTATANVIVSDGIVHFWGFYQGKTEKDAARVAAETIPGVKGIEDHRLRNAEITGAV